MYGKAFAAQIAEDDAWERAYADFEGATCGQCEWLEMCPCGCGLGLCKIDGEWCDAEGPACDASNFWKKG